MIKQALILTLAAATVTTATTARAEYQPTSRDIAHMLSEVATAFNQQLPKALDPWITMREVAANPDNSMTFRYQYSGPTIELAEFGPVMSAKYCTAPTFKMYRDYNISINFDWYGADGKFLRRFAAYNSKC